jgi:hypothetical protein
VGEGFDGRSQGTSHRGLLYVNPSLPSPRAPAGSHQLDRLVLRADDEMMRVPLKIAEVKERCCPRCFVSSWLYLVSSVLLPPPSYLVAVVVVEG